METTTRTRSVWEQATEDPSLRDLPYKVETNAFDQLVLSPHKPRHTVAQKRLIRLLDEHVQGDGEAYAEFAVETPDGVKVPDVVWISDALLDRIPEEAAASSVMPEVCVEVLSRSNSEAEMDAKRALYLRAGAAEVWLCSPDGALRFFDAAGPLERSALAPTMPPQLPQR